MVAVELGERFNSTSTVLQVNNIDCDPYATVNTLTLLKVILLSNKLTKLCVRAKQRQTTIHTDIHSYCPSRLIN